MYSIDVFLIVSESLPTLFVYELKRRGTKQQVTAGRKLADRLERIFSGHWVWTENLLVTDVSVEQEELDQVVKNVRANETTVFKDVVGLVPVPDWSPTAKVQADFVAQGLFDDLGNEINHVLQPLAVDLDGKATVEREHDIRGLVVRGQAAVSISIESRVIFREDLKTHSARLADPREIIGYFVSDKVRYENGTIFKGEIVSIAGKLDSEISRQDLIDIAQREASKEIIRHAEPDELVVRVGHNEYEYVLSALRIIVFPKHYPRFGIDSQKAQNATWIKPDSRTALVKRVSDIAQAKGLVGDALTSQNSNSFSMASRFNYDPTVLFENGKTAKYIGGGALFADMQRFGLHTRISEIGMSEQPLNIGIVNASRHSLDEAQIALQDQLRQLGFAHTKMFVEKASADVSRIGFEKAINALSEREPHIMLAIIPNSDSLDEDEWGPYYDFKSLMMDIPMPSQVIDQATVLKTKSLKYVMQNVALGMVAKMGHVPYILANPLDYADFVVGIDIARKRNRSGVGSQNAAALAQIYHRGGHFAQCRVIETTLEGETVPAPVLRSLFPLNEFKGKTVIIHRDGLFRGNEVAVIKEHMAQLEAQAFFVEVIKSGAPRLYSRNGSVAAPEIGTTFLLSDEEAFIVTSSSSTATPQPIHIRTEPPFTIGKALHSVLMLTLMHHGSLKRPKLPISIHYSDKIGYLALRGVKPRGGQSTDMYWL